MTLIAEYLADLGQAWREQAACRDTRIAPDSKTRVDLFFPDRGETATEALRICNRCPVEVECLRFALDNHIRDGVLGGTSEKERRKYLRALELQVPVPLRPPIRRHRRDLFVAAGFSLAHDPTCEHHYLVPPPPTHIAGDAEVA